MRPDKKRTVSCSGNELKNGCCSSVRRLVVGPLVTDEVVETRLRVPPRLLRPPIMSNCAAGLQVDAATFENVVESEIGKRPASLL